MQRLGAVVCDVSQHDGTVGSVAVVDGVNGLRQTQGQRSADGNIGSPGGRSGLGQRRRRVVERNKRDRRVVLNGQRRVAIGIQQHTLGPAHVIANVVSEQVVRQLRNVEHQRAKANKAANTPSNVHFHDWRTSSGGVKGDGASASKDGLVKGER